MIQLIMQDKTINTNKYSVNKLVRDDIKNKIDSNIKATFKNAPQIKYIILRKLLEEIQEVQNEILNNIHNKYNILNEMVDVLEALIKIMQIWNSEYKTYSLNELIPMIIRTDIEIVETKPLFIARKMYSLAIDLLKMNNETSENRVNKINTICGYFTALMHSLNIKYATLIAARYGKLKHFGGFNKNVILIMLEVPSTHHMIDIYELKYKKIEPNAIVE